jgi:sugar O-acyltransferase (sialic acid O-acetyltransferase NeuD family)
VRKQRKLVIVGDSVFAQIACEYFTHDSPYEVVAFSVEKKFLNRQRLLDLPLVPFEDVVRIYPPKDHDVFVAVVFRESNRLRARLYEESKRRGYGLASYISIDAVVSKLSLVGEHCFICEANVVQPFAQLGNNVILWSGNYIGHHAVIGDNCFILPNGVLSDWARLGQNCIMGANATVARDLSVGSYSVIGPGALITDNVLADTIIEYATEH